MKLLILANYANGLYLFRKELIEALLDDGHKVYVSVPPDENCDKLRTLDIELIETRLDRHGINPVKDFGLFRAYQGMIKDIRPDMVLTYTIKPNIYGGIAAGMSKTPYICNITGLGKAIAHGGILSKMLVVLYRIATKDAQKVFFQNEENRNVMWSKGIAKHNSDILPGSGVNLETHGFHEYPSEKDGIRFLAVLRIMKDKGIEEFLEAAKTVSENNMDVYFELVGEYEEDERDKYEPAIKELVSDGILKYHGHIDNVEEVMANSHVVIHPSYHEGMSNVLLEAAACGRPILTSDISGCREAVEEGVSGYLFEPESSMMLMQAIIRILKLSESERSEMGRQGRKLAKERFDRNIVIQKYRDEIKINS